MTPREVDGLHAVDGRGLVCAAGDPATMVRLEVTDHVVGDDVEDDAPRPEQRVEVHDDGVECVWDSLEERERQADVDETRRSTPSALWTGFCLSYRVASCA